MEAKNNLLCILNRFLGKITSARFIVTVLVIGTLCWSVDRCLTISASAAANKEVFTLMKDIVMLLLGAFVATTTAIVTAYFNRTDRAPKNGVEEEEEVNLLKK